MCSARCHAFTNTNSHLEARSQVVAAEDRDAMLQRLANVNGIDYTGLEVAVKQSDKLMTLDPVVRWASERSESLMKRLGNRYPVSPIPVVHYIFMKMMEVRNLRLIVRGKAVGFSISEIEERLF